MSIRSAPYNFPYAGGVYASALNGVGSEGDYWSRTANSNTYAYRLSFSSSFVAPASSNGRSSGYSIRCVATT